VLKASPSAADLPLTQAGIAQALLGSLSAEHLKSLGQMLEQDWKDRPEWGDMALAVMKGEKMRSGMGWWRPALKRYDWNWLRGHFDSNGDGRIDRDELVVGDTASGDFFARLDRDLDGKLTAADFDYSDQGMSMSPATMQGMMSSQVFRRLDADSNGRVTEDEWLDFFVRADRERLSFLAPDDLLAALYDPDLGRSGGRNDEPPASKMLQMLVSGQMGSLTSGPDYGEKAPDFTLPTHDGESQVTLADSFGKRPVVLVFGSFT
jgi:hypothetical protein